TNSLRERVNALSILFDGITESNVVNIIATKTSDSLITLTAKNGFILSPNLNSITAKIQIISVLAIVAKSGTATISVDDVNNMISTSVSSDIKIAALSMLFDGVNNQNINNITAKKTSEVLITLEAKPGFIFASGTTTLTANVKIITILPITIKPGTNNILQSDLDTMISSTASAANKTAALNKIFNGVTEADISKFTIEKSSNTTITLKANPNYSFGSLNTTSLISNIKIITILNIKITNDSHNITTGDFQNLSGSDVQLKLNALNVLFVGINHQNINNFDIQIDSRTQLTLKAKDGYAFNSITNFSLTTNMNVYEIIDIRNKKGAIGIHQWAVNVMISPTADPNERVKVLNWLFEGVTLLNLPLLDRVTQTGRSAVNLFPKKGYAFWNENGIVFQIYTNTHMLGRFLPHNENILHYDSNKKYRK
ncbi:MAG: hypothetical protein ACRCRP_00025, partial [Metamycoplasmataceae bacterium]